MHQLPRFSKSFGNSEEFRRNCVLLTVRFLGGDESLVDEIRANRTAQKELAVTNPAHPARRFGEADESSAVLASYDSVEVWRKDIR